ncbi:GNAT family N-acetyltransferase [Kaistella sp. G5-32]|uniref:GNAT family N-acetyltransferase n=1 Tax=Kaistella gelatinilytica TaxID=2787636 RepID=A0ABS0FBP0_9FLAO|nr:GNAT family N-acetyltransferase [Kaistella gelatinilytica]MBF8457135.1 GNAT family N-acetyltransferase [Kaistella gelatinilytica]
MIFSTERLILRTVTEHDSVEILGIRSNIEINRFLQRNPPKDSFEALEFILNIKRKSANNEIVFLGISTQNNPKLLGTICLWKFSEDRKTAELGYELLPEYHGKGIMSEAVNFILNYGFNDLNLNKIEAFTNKNNLNSIKLLQKSKFVLNENRSDEKFPENIIFELNAV